MHCSDVQGLNGIHALPNFNRKLSRFDNIRVNMELFEPITNMTNLLVSLGEKDGKRIQQDNKPRQMLNELGFKEELLAE